VAQAASFQNISPELTETRFVDTNSVSGQAFYRVIAKP
jgi:hypothetical protein